MMNFLRVLIIKSGERDSKLIDYEITFKGLFVPLLWTDIEWNDQFQNEKIERISQILQEL